MDVAEELLDVDHTVDRAYVERRLDEWRARLDRLYADIESWLPATWSMADGGHVPILEDLMLRFEVPRQEVPARALLQQGSKAGRIEPRGLWIIGSNGRVDVTGPMGHFVINDRSDAFEKPSWHIAAFFVRLDEIPLTIDSFRQTLR